MRYWMPLLAVLSLTGCKTIDEANMDRDDAKCLSYGVQKGSPHYVECRLQLEQQRAANRRALLASPAPVLSTPTFATAPALPQPTRCQWIANVWTCQ
jgi:hypothetical protein